MEEREDEDYPCQKGLNLSDPILLGPEDQADFEPISDEEEDNLEEIIKEFTRDRYPDGPRFKQPGFDPSLPSVLPPEQMDDLNDILFVMCEEQAGNAKVKGPLTKKDLPCLRQEWVDKFSDMLRGVPETLPPFREVNHHIPLVDKQKKYNYYLLKCPDSMRKPLSEKISNYCKAGWWCPARVEQAAPMLVVPKKNGTLRTVINALKQNANTIKDVTPFPDQDLSKLDVA
jgi:hypothetical protein